MVFLRCDSGFACNAAERGLKSGSRGNSSGDEEAGGGGERREIVFGEPSEGFKKVSGEGERMEEFCDGLGFEGDISNLAQNDAGGGFFAEGDEDDLAREEIQVGRIGEGTAAIAINFSRDNLEKHRDIIAYEGRMGAKD